MTTPDQHATPADSHAIQRLGRLARLRIEDDEAARLAPQLDAILRHVAKVAELDLEGVDPMASPSDEPARLGQDTPGPTLDRQAVLDLAPDRAPPFIKVPKVLAPPSEP